MPTSVNSVKALWRVTKIVLETLDFDQVAQKICDSLLSELDYLRSGYRIIVLSLYREDLKGLERVALSHTPEAQAAMDASPIPFRDIVIPIGATDNLCVKAFLEKKPHVTNDWKDILSPPLRASEARGNQEAAGIHTSMVFPIILKGKAVGTVIFSMVKDRQEVTKEEMDLIAGFTDIIGIAVQNAKLYSDLQATSNRLNDANMKLMELDRLKDEFISITSHELRTPMTAIKGYLWLLLKEKVEPLQPKTREYLERVYNSTERLIHLVNDMLDVSRITSGKIQLHEQPFNPVTLAEEVAQLFLAKAMQRHIKMAVKADKTVPMLTADREKMQQVLGNLVGNALKFTHEEGTVTIQVKQDKNELVYKIQDNGPGIKKEDLPKLFKKFGRVDSSLTPRSGVGTGLGLYICKQFIDLHHGTISVESIPGKGATFIVSLPLDGHGSLERKGKTQ